jgi:hypothetical protein
MTLPFQIHTVQYCLMLCVDLWVEVWPWGGPSPLHAAPTNDWKYQQIVGLLAVDFGNN